MNNNAAKKIAVSALVLASSAHALAHVTLPNAPALTGSVYLASFRIGHVCAGSTLTTGISVRLPEGFAFLDAEPKAGWAFTQKAHEVSWNSTSAEGALRATDKAEFVLRGNLPAEAGLLWFKVLQTCDKTSADWSETPRTGAPFPAFPAARLEVLTPGQAVVSIRNAWSRPVPTALGTAGVYVELEASKDLRLVEVSSPIADAAEIHEMRMDGDVMHMRALDNGLALPAGKRIDMAPGGHHVMLFGVSRPLAIADSFPIRFSFVGADGIAMTREVQVQVRSPGEAQTTGHHH